MVQLVILSGVRSRPTESTNWWQRKSALSCTLGKASPCFFSWSYRSSFDGTSRVWDSVTGDCLCSFDDHKKNVYALAFSPDGRHIATAGGDGCLHIYDIRVSHNELLETSFARLTYSIRRKRSDGHGVQARRTLVSSRSSGSSPAT